MQIINVEKSMRRILDMSGVSRIIKIQEKNNQKKEMNA